MSVDPDQLRQSGRKLSETGTLVERAVHAARTSNSTLGRIAAAISVVELGARVIPAAGRLLRRYPVGSLLLVAGFVGALYVMSARQAAHRPPLSRAG